MHADHASSDFEEAAPAAPSPYVSLQFEDGSADRDFAWIAARVMELTGATDVVIALHAPDRPRPELLMAHGLVAADEAELEVVLVSCTAIPAHRRFAERSDLHWTIPDQNGGLPMLTSILAEEGHNRVVLVALFRAGFDGGQNGAGAAAQRLHPVLVGYFRLWLVARAQSKRIRGYETALNVIDTPLFLLDGHGNLLFGNDAGLSLVTTGEGLRRSGASLSASEMADAIKLRVAIDHSLSLDHSHEARSATIVRLHRPRGRRPLIVAVLAISAAQRQAQGPALVVIAFDPERDMSSQLMSVCRIYELSQSETRLTCLLAEGLTVHEAADRMRVKIPTLRTYLKQIFSKTGTARQSDLMRLLMGSVVRTLPGIDHYII